MASDPQVQPVADPETRVYNRSPRRTFIHGKFRAAPSAFVTVPASVAKVWLELFPEDVVEAAVAQKQLGGAAAELAAVRAELEKAQAEIAALKTSTSVKTKPKTTDLV